MGGWAWGEVRWCSNASASIPGEDRRALSANRECVVDALGDLERIGVADDLVGCAVGGDQYQRRGQVHRHPVGDRQVAVDLVQRDRELEHLAAMGRNGPE